MSYVVILKLFGTSFILHFSDERSETISKTLISWQSLIMQENNDNIKLAAISHFGRRIFLSYYTIYHILELSVKEAM